MSSREIDEFRGRAGLQREMWESSVKNVLQRVVTEKRRDERTETWELPTFRVWGDNRTQQRDWVNMDSMGEETNWWGILQANRGSHINWSVMANLTEYRRWYGGLKNTNLFLTVLESGSLRSGSSMGRFWGELSSGVPISSYVLMWQKQKKETSSFLSLLPRALIASIRTAPSGTHLIMSHLLISSHWGE